MPSTKWTAFLDGVNVERWAALIAARRRGQFLVVSHREAMIAGRDPHEFGVSQARGATPGVGLPVAAEDVEHNDSMLSSPSPTGSRPQIDLLHPPFDDPPQGLFWDRALACDRVEWATQVITRDTAAGWGLSGEVIGRHRPARK